MNPSSMYFVFIRVVALFPVMPIFKFWSYRQQPRLLQHELPLGGTPRVTFTERRPPGEEPKLFDLYVKPGLEVGGTIFEGTLVSFYKFLSTRKTGNRCMSSRLPFVQRVRMWARKHTQLQLPRQHRLLCVGHRTVRAKRLTNQKLPLKRVRLKPTMSPS